MKEILDLLESENTVHLFILKLAEYPEILLQLNPAIKVILQNFNVETKKCCLATLQLLVLQAFMFNDLILPNELFDVNVEIKGYRKTTIDLDDILEKIAR